VNEAHRSVSEAAPECLAISLDPPGERCLQFLANNSHLTVEVVQGIRGKDLSGLDRKERGLVTPEAARSGLVNDGSVGCAASHQMLWQRVVNSGRSTLILEDDVITHPRLLDFIAVNRATLEATDIVQFGINTDSVLDAEAPNGLREVRLFRQRYPEPSLIQQFLGRTSIDDVRLHRLFKCFGMCCYFVTPQGARQLLQMALPLTLETTDVPLVARAMPGTSADRRLNGFYGKLAAFVTIPFLAWTPNSDSATR
jgi:GR25 family glycosyltransferase involved in LPS biosynthesis